MPTTYAHLRFGKEVLPLLPKDLQAEIKQYLPLANMDQTFCFITVLTIKML